MTCEIRLRKGRAVCTTCGLVIGERSVSLDCPRQREAYGLTAPVSLAAADASTNSNGDRSA